MEPCYKKFTAIISSLKQKSTQSHPESTRAKRTKLNEPAGFFPKVCFFCKQTRKAFNKRSYCPYKITTVDAEKKIKEAALLKEDEQLLLHIREVDLIAKEFMMHKPCYNNYVCQLTKKADDKKEVSECQREIGDFGAVKNVIQKTILLNNQALSITALHKLYKVGYGSQFERSYRAKLKKRIVYEFDDALIS